MSVPFLTATLVALMIVAIALPLFVHAIVNDKDHPFAPVFVVAVGFLLWILAIFGWIVSGMWLASARPGWFNGLAGGMTWVCVIGAVIAALTALLVLIEEG